MRPSIANDGFSQRNKSMLDGDRCPQSICASLEGRCYISTRCTTLQTRCRQQRMRRSIALHSRQSHSFHNHCNSSTVLICSSILMVTYAVCYEYHYRLLRIDTQIISEYISKHNEMQNIIKVSTTGHETKKLSGKFNYEIARETLNTDRSIGRIHSNDQWRLWCWFYPVPISTQEISVTTESKYNSSQKTLQIEPHSSHVFSFNSISFLQWIWPRVSWGLRFYYKRLWLKAWNGTANLASGFGQRTFVKISPNVFWKMEPKSSTANVPLQQRSFSS